MKKILCMLLISLTLSGCTMVPSRIDVGTKILMDENMRVEQIASLIKPAIVGVSAVNSGDESVGSGVCVAEKGYILTNSHVVNGCEDITLHLADKSQAKAEVIFNDSVNDLAILKSSVTLPYLPIGDSDELSVGQDVLAVGTPLSLNLVHSYTKGIVSALNRTLQVGSERGAGFMQNLIQHDASLNPGNSGGPLINSKGEVVGINTLKISGGEGIGFAIPSKSFKSLLNSFATKNNYEMPYLGIYGYDCEIANYRGQSERLDGFYVINVADNSPLKSVGFPDNCVLTSINNQKINNTLDLKNELYKLERKEMINLTFWHEGEEYRLVTTLK